MSGKTQSSEVMLSELKKKEGKLSLYDIPA